MNVRLDDLPIDKDSLTGILNFLPYPFVLAHNNGGRATTAFINARFTEEIGYSLDEIETIDDWFAKAYPQVEYRTQIINSWKAEERDALAAGRDSFLVKARIRTKYKGDVWYEVKASVAGTFQFIAFVDINEIVKQEVELRLLDENKNRTLSILSHDLRTPLTSLLALSQLAAKASVTPQEFLSTMRNISKKTEQALELLNTTLNWTRTNFEEITVNKQPVKIGDVVETALRLYENSFKAKNIRIARQNLGDYQFKTDRDILTIIVRNLISNAIKFTPEKGTITIRLTRFENTATITIEDTGNGMTNETINAITGGHVVSREGTHREKGVGIGLKFCLELARKMGAIMTFTSVVGEGTKVDLTLS